MKLVSDSPNQNWKGLGGICIRYTHIQKQKNKADCKGLEMQVGVMLQRIKK